FDHHHLIVLGISFTVWVLLPWVSQRSLNSRKQKMLVWFLVFFAVAQEIVDYWNRMQVRPLSWDLDLPFHVCHYALIFSTIALISKNQFLFEFSYLTGMTAALQALLTPDMTDFDNWVSYITFYIHHSLIILFCIWLIVIDGMRTTRGAVFRTMLLLNLMIIPAGVANWLTGGNYMYLCSIPNVTNPLVFGTWPWYLINFEIIGFLLMCLFNLPMTILRRKAAFVYE
ncbi:MAG: TIGR02206 family membrane protein, partial [Fidelibacterota bacterium]